ncbi:MAG: DUF3089 domain-containing protein [Candidatus Delongbacteria bacterium]|nr:DUF3089 domain-containing protein [Candidatus Delongbacteria bacterium]
MIVLCSGSVHQSPVPDRPDYNNTSYWAYRDSLNLKTIDVFFVCPTVYSGTDSSCSMPLSDSISRANFLGAINMEKGLYDPVGNFYAPYYRQVGLNVYTMDSVKAEPCFQIAYQDIRAAFLYYLDHYNQGRPIILAGFSQGSDMLLRLMKDIYHRPDLQQKLVAAYLIGWRITPADTLAYPQLKTAKTETDLGVIVSFNTEAIGITRSLIVPHYTLGINPLNWQTGSAVADRSLNRGAVFTNYSGTIDLEIPNLTGAYRDSLRGTIKVTDIRPEDYPPIISLFAPGEYHIYDYLFFYRNLQDNIRKRAELYLALHH